MLFFWPNGFLRSLIPLGVRLFGNNENEELQLDSRGERLVDAYGSDGSPFARLAPDLSGADDTAGLERAAVRRARQRQLARQKPTRPATGHSQASDGVSERDGDDSCPAACVQESVACVFLTAHALRTIVEYRLESAPLPLAVAAAGARLRLAGEEASTLFFPGAATRLRLCPPSAPQPPHLTARVEHTSGRALTDVSAAPLRESARLTGSSSYQHSSEATAVLAGEAPPPLFTRVVRGPSLPVLVAAMAHSAWWYGRPVVLCGGAVSAAVGDEVRRYAVRVEGDETDSVACSLDTLRCCVSLPLCVEVVAPRLALPLAVAAPQSSSLSTSWAAVRLWWWVGCRLCALLSFSSSSSSTAASQGVVSTPAEAEMHRAVARFVELIDELWRTRRCALVDCVLERYPVALAERLLSADLPPLPSSCPQGVASSSPGDESFASPAGQHRLSARRAFRHLRTLACRGRVGHASAAALSAATANARGAASAAASAPGLMAAAAATALPVCLSPHSFALARDTLRVLDLAGSAVAAVDGVATLPLLERIIVTGCAQLSSLSPLGLAPSLREIVASQSGVYELEGLSRSRSLVSLSLYGCLQLTDVGACGSIPTLRELFISESTVEVVEGLGRSRSLVRLGMRYCDITRLTALASVGSLRVLHASCSTLTSVAPLRHCAALEAVELAACAQLTDLGPLGLAPNLRELDASGSGVRHVDGLRHSASLETLLLAQCAGLEDVGALGQCINLRQLSLAGSAVRSLDGLAGAPALLWLDISFCRQLTSFGVLLQLPQLRQVSAGGCTTALRHPEEVRAVVESLSKRHNKVVMTLT